MKTVIFKLTALAAFIGITIPTVYGMNKSLTSSLETNAQHDAAHTSGDIKASVEQQNASADSKQAAAVQQSSLVTIHVPETYGAVTTFDLAETEALTTLTFEELRDTQSATGDSLIIARVTSQGSPSTPTFIHYFEAHSLNRYIMGRDYPYANISANERQLLNQNGQPLKNPSNNLPIKSIQYFSFHPKQHAQGFTFLCSHIDFMAEKQDNGHWLLKFYANQNHDMELKNTALSLLNNIAAIYFNNNQYIQAAAYQHAYQL